MMNGKLSSKLLILISSIGGVLALVLLFLPTLSAEYSHTLSPKQLYNLPALEIGDIILRKGVGIESAVIEKLSHHDYTHIGLVISTQPIIILHATPDDNPKKPNQVILSSFDEFLSHARKIAIKRFALSTQQRDKIALEAPLWLGESFILSTDAKALYCTTLLERIFAPHIKLNLAYDYIDVPAFKGAYLFPKAFYENTQSYVIFTH